LHLAYPSNTHQLVMMEVITAVCFYQWTDISTGCGRL